MNAFLFRLFEKPSEIPSVEKAKAKEWIMSDALSRRFVTVTAPSIVAAIGEVLRKAFGRPPSAEAFAPLVARIDRPKG
jgi:hypothetical protein